MTVDKIQTNRIYTFEDREVLVAGVFAQFDEYDPDAFLDSQQNPRVQVQFYTDWDKFGGLRGVHTAPVDEFADGATFEREFEGGRGDW